MKPTIAEVRELVTKMLTLANGGWIGEGDEIAADILAYIDGDLTVLASWIEDERIHNERERMNPSAKRITYRRRAMPGVYVISLG
jgi:hypothetical protein